MNTNLNDRILIAAPTGRDGELMCKHLAAAGLHCVLCENAAEVANCAREGVGAIIVTEEALTSDGLRALERALTEQPPWSEVPLIILTGDSLLQKTRNFDGLEARTNITLIDRPVRIKALVSAAHTALRARQRQYQNRDLMQQLEDRVHERDKFLAILGHELRNPLSAILLASQMTDDDTRLDNEHVRLIERQSRHLTQLVNDLLDLSRVVTGKIILKPQFIDLRDVAAQSVLTTEPSAQARNIAMLLEMPDQAVHIHADPVRVEQIITNLLTNAIKYTPEGGHVEVKVTAEKDAAVTVTDDGVGIASNRIDHIFEMFTQLDNAIGQAQGGMGIGLALVRNLAQLHGGSVDAKSDGAGKGSRFTVTFPLAGADLIAIPEPAIVRSAQHTEVTSRRIVIIEDNADVRDLLRLKLRRLGHQVTSVADGLEGLHQIVTTQPDLALVDLGLPGLDGFEVARQTRAKIGDGIVLVAVSGFGQPDDKRRALEAGFDEHITKPAEVRDIERLLMRFPPRNSSISSTL